jgi:hypothetical protein
VHQENHILPFTDCFQGWFLRQEKIIALSAVTLVDAYLLVVLQVSTYTSEYMALNSK